MKRRAVTIPLVCLRTLNRIAGRHMSHILSHCKDDPSSLDRNWKGFLLHGLHYGVLEPLSIFPEVFP